MTSISVQHVVKLFGRVRALDDVSVEIASGELFFLLGPSGCGKTTLLRCLAGFYIPDAGRIRFGDRDVTRLDPQRRNTAMVFQSYALWPHMTVESNVAFGLGVRRVPRAERRRRVAEALELVRMGQYAKRKPNELSGGQQQRVALARALVVRPQCLLLDEPLSNLDAKLRLEMRGEIRRLVKEFRLTAVYVTHDQKEALSIADRMALMFSGRIVQVGAPHELYRRPAGAAVADFLGDANFFDGAIERGPDGQFMVSTPLGVLHAEPANREIERADAAISGDSGLAVASDSGSIATARAGAAAATHRAPPTVFGPTGTRCIVSIRPESIVLPPRDVQANRLTGRVAESVYLGESTQLTLEVGGARLRAMVMVRAGDRIPKRGESVMFAIDPRDVVVLKA